MSYSERRALAADRLAKHAEAMALGLPSPYSPQPEATDELTPPWPAVLPSTH